MRTEEENVMLLGNYFTNEAVLSSRLQFKMRMYFCLLSRNIEEICLADHTKEPVPIMYMAIIVECSEKIASLSIILTLKKSLHVCVACSSKI